jgi:hypothetical protein
MYTADDLDTVVELHDVPPSCCGAPIPVVVSDEGKVLLAYIAAAPIPNWDGIPRSVGPDSSDKLIAVIKFWRPCAHMFGPPNDEAFHGHPLASRGLTPYGIFEIKNSSWIRRLERMNSVHRLHNPLYFRGLGHFIFCFHDSTFECIAENFEVEMLRGSIRSALGHMVELMRE